jgi:hypothetical protein
MTQVKPTLGWALAHLQATNNEIFTQFAQDQRSYLEQIVNRLKILNSDGQMATILTSLPDGGCTSSTPFLEHNDDYFIVLFSNTKNDQACINLYNHLFFRKCCETIIIINHNQNNSTGVNTNDG